jgi:hypothetical protein
MVAWLMQTVPGGAPQVPFDAPVGSPSVGNICSTFDTNVPPFVKAACHY